MLCVDKVGFSLCVTPDHNMFVRTWLESERRIKDNAEFVKAKDIGWYTVVPRTGNWVGKEVAVFSINNRNNLVHDVDTHHISMDVWVEFLGIYVADGCVSSADKGNWRIEIAAKKERKRNHAVDVLRRMPYKFTAYKDRYVINNKALYNELLPIGKANTKTVPDYVKSLSPRQIKIFLDAFISCDGHTTKTGRRCLFTSSKRLIDDLQELLIKSGSTGNVRVRQPRETNIDGRLVVGGLQYEMWEKEKKSSSIEKKKDLFTKEYQGKVYCFEVENHVMMVRRGGTAYWCGNSCVGHGLTHALLSEPYYTPGLDAEFAREEVYYQAQRRDPWPGGEYPGARPKYSGTTVQAGLEALKDAGYIRGWKTAYTFEQLLTGLSFIGPAVIGSRWFAGMTKPDKLGFLRPAGSLTGGHCYIIRAQYLGHQRFRLANSWGTQWGDDGECYINFDDFRKLMSFGMDIAFLTV